MTGSPATEHTSSAQRLASGPAVTAWVSANAGSGKTYVLVNRIVRLLLSGIPPERILCLTFTKAAAAEMTNRLHARLGRWALCPEAELRAALRDLLDRAAGGQEISAARRLFARTLETPGGLKIQTIHAFAESLLHRFPLEAQIAPDFEVLDEITQKQILEKSRKAVLERPGPETMADLAHVTTHVQETAFDRLLSEIVQVRSTIGTYFKHHGGLTPGFAGIRSVLGVYEDDTETGIAEAISGPGAVDRDRVTQAIEILASGAATDCQSAERFLNMLQASAPEQRAGAYLEVFFTGPAYSPQRKPRSRLITRKIATAHPELEQFLLSEQGRLEPLYERMKAFQVWQATAALLKIAVRILERYALEKRSLGALDYDDLIDETVALLTREGAGWVLYKLDGGLDHILVDEAQDTSPAQWRLIGALADEFYTGRGARDGVRTMFAVGDEKQSIYSFQGADPRMFATMHRHFEQKAKSARAPFEGVRLTISFRSSDTILWAVDEVFANPPASRGLTALGGREAHQSARTGAPGRVEIWPTEKPEPEKERDPWDAPLDWQNPDSPRVRLAKAMAQKIAAWLADGKLLPGRGRAVRPDDILILVRRRDRFVEALVRALKQNQVPVAGADRMKLADQISVLDLLALAESALLPDDDLTLACVLKSPLIGLSEDDLFALSQPRGKKSLWRQLLHLAESDDRLMQVSETLRTWFALADFKTPFEFFSTVLAAHGGRRKLRARLGVEIDDPLDELLSLTLRFEQRKTASLQGFLRWFHTAQSEIKRDLSQAGGEVRIMTVHGAKGLEANIVILADTCTTPGRQHDSGLMLLEDETAPENELGVPVWRLNSGYDTAPVAQARTFAQAEREAEYHRLLYVAMTRAREWLIVAGHEDRLGRREGCWYDLVLSALRDQLSEQKDGSGHVISWYRQSAPSAELPKTDEAGERPAKPGLPGWLSQAPPLEEAPISLKAPSRMAEYDNTAPEDQSIAASPAGVRIGTTGRQRGLCVHTLLQVLPGMEPALRRPRAVRYLATPKFDFSRQAQSEIVDEVLSVLECDALQDLFGPRSKAEVSVAGWAASRAGTDDRVAVAGRIDRLAVLDETVVIADFKTDRQVPADVRDVPAAYLAQLAAYRSVVQRLYPLKQVRCSLVWTAGPVIMDVSADILDPAP